MSRALLLLVACSTTLMGCILRDFDYQDPVPVPPSVETLATGDTPFNRIVNVDLDQEPNPDAGVAPEQQFEAEVRDPDIDETLEGRVYLDNNLALELRPIPTALDSDDPVRRRVSFSIPRESFTMEKCYLVELLVTSEGGFEPFPSRLPRRTGDIGSGTWWVRVHRSEGPVDMGRCTVGL